MITDKPERRSLEDLSLPELYQHLGRETDNLYGNILENIIEGIRLRLALALNVISTFQKLNLVSDTEKANRIVKEGENSFVKDAGIRTRVRIGKKLKDSREDLKNKGVLVLANHQGGGLETVTSRHILASIFDKPVHWLLKEELLSIPRFGTIIKKTGPISVRRPKGEDDQITKEELKCYVEQIVERLKQKRAVAIAYEGTRSLDGRILMDTKDAKFVALLGRLIKKQVGNSEIVEILMTVNTLNCFPRQIEKNPLTKTRFKGVVNVDLDLLEDNANLSTAGEDSIFKIAERRLRAMLVKEIEALR
jgi:1-acyl-sn-glycerol-3-phosphate acyltransferase